VVKVNRDKILFWTRQQSWLMIKESNGAGVDAFGGLLTFVSPSGNIVNFALNSDGECVDVYEGRRQDG